MKPKKKTILQQYESLAPEEITLLSELLEQAVKNAEENQQKWMMYISSFDNFDTKTMLGENWIEDQIEQLDNYKLKVNKIKEISDKIKPLKELVNNE